MTNLFTVRANAIAPHFDPKAPMHFIVSFELYKGHEVPFVNLPCSDELDPSGLRHKDYYCHYGLTDYDCYFQSDADLCMTEVMLWSKAAQLIQEHHKATGTLKEISIRMCDETGAITLPFTFPVCSYASIM